MRIILNKLRFFFQAITEQQGKEAGSNFVSFSCSRNLIGQFIKTYFHRPIMILHYFPRRGFQNCLTVVMRNGKTVWMAVWTEYHLKWNLSSQRN